MTAVAQRQALLGLTVEELVAVLGPALDRPFRARQVHDAIHRQGVRTLEEISTLPQRLRERLSASFEIGWPKEELIERSPDGTEKIAYVLGDGAQIETVDIPEDDRRTFCVSSQVGCALGCRFCVTGYWGAGRDLTAGEILGQVLGRTGPLHGRGEQINVVFMGMGEPLLNVAAVRRATEVLLEDLSWRRVTVSTAGVVPGIRDLATWPQRPRLAVSLHAPDDELRARLMPIARKHPLDELLGALREHPVRSGEKITFEYLMLDRKNDSEREVRGLVRLLSGLPAKVNLIPLNPDPVLDPDLAPSPPDRVEAFRRGLVARGIVCTVRRERGARVSAACGQLRVPGREPRGFRGVLGRSSRDADPT